MAQGLTRDEVMALPASVRLWPEAGRALHLGKSKCYELAAAGEFPVPVLRLGKVYRVRSADLIKFLGIADGDTSTVTVA